jgi:hypothetical protein
MVKMRIIGVALAMGLLSAPAVAQQNEYAVKVALYLSGLSSRPHKISKSPDHPAVKIVSGNRSLFVYPGTRCKIEWVDQTEKVRSEQTTIFLDRISNWPKVGGPRYMFSSSTKHVQCSFATDLVTNKQTESCSKVLDLRDDEFEWAKEAEDWVMSAVERCNSCR